jgi:hypothetical protein
MRALDYPFAIPERSFVFVAGEVREPGEVEIDTAGRTPLLAYGSNAAPEMLRRKLGEGPDPALLLRAVLHDFDAVYSDHVSAYGAVPATLHAGPGTELPVFVAYLSETQLELIAQSEPNYELRRLRGVECRLEDDGEALTELDAYLSRHGFLPDEAGSPLALSAIPARGRTFAAVDQAEAKRRRARRASRP